VNEDINAGSPPKYSKEKPSLSHEHIAEQLKRTQSPPVPNECSEFDAIVRPETDYPISRTSSPFLPLPLSRATSSSSLPSLVGQEGARAEAAFKEEAAARAEEDLVDVWRKSALLLDKAIDRSRMLEEGLSYLTKDFADACEKNAALSGALKHFVEKSDRSSSERATLFAGLANEKRKFVFVDALAHKRGKLDSFEASLAALKQDWAGVREWRERLGEVPVSEPIFTNKQMQASAMGRKLFKVVNHLESLSFHGTKVYCNVPKPSFQHSMLSAIISASNSNSLEKIMADAKIDLARFDMEMDREIEKLAQFEIEKHAQSNATTSVDSGGSGGGGGRAIGRRAMVRGGGSNRRGGRGGKKY